jgi:predicted DNA-binding transcriptional regulator AlpA
MRSERDQDPTDLVLPWHFSLVIQTRLLLCHPLHPDHRLLAGCNYHTPCLALILHGRPTLACIGGLMAPKPLPLPPIPEPHPLAAPDGLMDPRTCAAFLGVSHLTLSDWRTKGEGPTSLKVGRYVRYRRSDLEAWLNSHAKKGS